MGSVVPIATPLLSVSDEGSLVPLWFCRVLLEQWGMPPAKLNTPPTVTVWLAHNGGLQIIEALA